MKLPLTADLHFRLHWFRWLIEQAPNFDLICVAGDLLDMFKAETRTEQAREIKRLVESLRILFRSHFVPAITIMLAD
jgi:Icc-related predicted phosphoesterase